jgi:large subunit ribosomal protein L4
MESLNVIDIETGKVKETLEIPESLKKYFDYKNAKYVLHEYVVAYLANQRQGTHSTKTRAEVRGGGRKPWVQKHTGRARQGSIRSPLWRKGGVVFGPKPRDYSVEIPKKKKTLAKYLSIAEKIKSNDLIVVDKLNLNSHKTKEALKILKNLNINSDKILFVDKSFDNNIKLATRNLQNVSLSRLQDLNAYIVLDNNKIIFTKEAFLCL